MVIKFVPESHPHESDRKKEVKKEKPFEVQTPDVRIGIGIDDIDSMLNVVQRITGKGNTDEIDDQRYRKAQPIGQKGSDLTSGPTAYCSNICPSWYNRNPAMIRSTMV